MRVMDKEQFWNALLKRGYQNERFKIEQSEEKVKSFLYMAYYKEVEDRRSTFIKDEATMEMIAKAAKWLTADLTE